MVSWSAIYLALVALVALERAGELWLSRRNARRAFAHGAVELGTRDYRVMTLFHSAFLVACAAQALLQRRAHADVVAGVALAGAVAAQALRYWAIAALGERWNTRVIVLPGAPAVVSGPYRFIRHPNYVAVALEMLCLPLALGATASGALLALVFFIGNALILRRRIRTEEAALGPGYARAFAHRPRFIPGGAGW